MLRRPLVPTIVLLGGLLTALIVPAAPVGAQASPYSATIVRTEYGIPHVTGATFADVAYGFAQAHAADNICTLADAYVTVNAERSRYFGPTGTWTFRGNSTTNNNRSSDFAYAAVTASGIIEALLAEPPPRGPLPEIVTGVPGYVAGYNDYLASIGGPDGITDPRCKGAEWVKPIDEGTVYRRFFQLASLASAGVAINGIGSAQPPTPGIGGLGASSPRELSTDETVDLLTEGFSGDWLGIGSNAYGFGKDVTDNGRGMVLGNPHFPWHEGERLYQWHATIPGQLDVAGASLLGVPIVLIGHTAGAAWSHTVSTARRFTVHELTLNPADPTQYMVDGVPESMEPYPVSIEVLQSDGSLATESRTLYRTRYGWMTSGILGLPIFPWAPGKAFALGDANEQLRYLNHFVEINKAQSTLDIQRILKTYQGIPWVNTISADRDGRAYYADIGAVPNVTDEQAQTCSTAAGQAALPALRVFILDGSRASCDLQTDADAVAPRILGPANMPELFRDDYVTNSNDSYWLTNPEEPLTGFDLIIGDEGTTRSLRTRLGLRIVADRLDGSDEYTAVNPNRWTQDLLQDAVFNNRQHAAELTRDAAVAMCRGFGGNAPSARGTTATTQGGVDGCQVLEDWDLRDNLDSVGSLLFRRFWTRAAAANGGPWVNRFSVSDPVNTPNTLNVDLPEVQKALGDAITDLLGAGIPLDAPLGDFQSETRGDEGIYPAGTPSRTIPIHGGPGTLGVFNAINVAWDAAAGYPDVDHGSSFVMVAQFVDGDCPVDADAIVTYGQSEDPTSPYFEDQTLNYSQKIWNTMPFCPDEIAALTISTQTVGGAPAPAPSDPMPAPSPLPTTGGGLALLGLATLAAARATRSSRRRIG